jgi:uncharacterized DUF497 family protein
MHSFPYTLSKHAQECMAERGISMEWVERVLFKPTLVESDPKDPTLNRAFGVIPENGNRVLRVVYNHTTAPWNIVSVFFDRSKKGKL